jgi:hypothetical protein
LAKINHRGKQNVKPSHLPSPPDLESLKSATGVVTADIRSDTFNFNSVFVDPMCGPEIRTFFEPE